MDSNSMRSRAAPSAWVGRIEWNGVALWLLGFALVAYLGLEGGGYDAPIHDRVGIAVWWFLLLGVAVAALPRRRPATLALAGLALLAAFVAWTALSLTWTESGERTLADLARVLLYLGVFALALFGSGRDGARNLAAGLAAGVVLVASIALLSRFEPAWFPAADETAQFLGTNRERLSYPLHYWNGLAALLAIGLPPLLYLASDARTIAVRVLGAGALPILVLALFLTLSRGGLGAAVIAFVLYLVLASDRLPKLLTSLIAGVGGVVLCLAVASRDALHDGFSGPVAETQGDEMLLLTAGVCVVVAALQAGLWRILGDRPTRPRPSHGSPRRYLAAGGVAAVVLLGLSLALGAPDRAADAWDEFKRPDSPGEGSGRLISASGQNRYEYWRSAVDQNATEPLTGTGSGTFEYWWTRDRTSADAVRDTHSLYMQTLGELGIVGLLLLVAFLLVVLLGGAVTLFRADGERRSLLAAALAGCVAFCISAAFDWTWQIPVIPVALLLLAAALLTPAGEGGEGDRGGLRLPLRIGFAAIAAAAIVAISVPLATTSLVRESEADARAGDPIGALEAARSAENVQPGAATPRLQQALVLEEIGDLAAAAEAATEATERESTNWRTWLILSRIEARRGNAVEAVQAFRRARSLNPLSPLFER
ncbi:MAG TPA: O-antigen ligase family protein [Solirubrobacterales bacterium]|nr:O-antigen ligase family protein [Solirubrobacterales bacterium]